MDIWCVGVLAFELCTGNAPFAAETSLETELKIRSNLYKMPEKFSPELKDFIRKVLVNNSTKRIKLQEAIVHPWITKNNSVTI